ncbi:hypothetical protein BC937DRAFT_93739, partial [Endogone sp. FLAS-F59071]
MIRHSCAKSYSCLSIAYDELAYLVSSRVLDPRLEAWIKEHIAEDVVEDQLKGMPIKTWMELEDPNDPEVSNMRSSDCHFSSSSLSHSYIRYIYHSLKSNVTVNIYPCLCAPIQSSDTIQQRDRILSLCSLFKLMQACLKASSGGSTHSISALLECGLAMYEKVEVSIISLKWISI